MATSYEVTFLETGESQRFHSRDADWYVFDDGRSDLVITDIIWCHGCQQLTLGEWIEPLTKLDAAIGEYEKEIADLQSFRFPPGRNLISCLLQKRQWERTARYRCADLQKRRHWLANRVSSAKCFTCGTTEIIALSQADEVETPIGRVALRHSGWATIMGAENRFFSQEGDRIEYTPPPYKPRAPERKWWEFWK